MINENAPNAMLLLRARHGYIANRETTTVFESAIPSQRTKAVRQGLDVRRIPPTRREAHTWRYAPPRGPSPPCPASTTPTSHSHAGETEIRISVQNDIFPSPLHSRSRTRRRTVRRPRPSLPTRPPVRIHGPLRNRREMAGLTGPLTALPGRARTFGQILLRAAGGRHVEGASRVGV